MVRPMKCPYCNNMVSVSSHWKETTCPNCKNVFEIGLEVFELSEDEPEKTEFSKKKKFGMIVIVASGVAILVAVIFILSSVLHKNPVPAEEVVTEYQAEITETVNTIESQMYDSGWNDGYAIDSNSEDGRFKIDLQSSDTGEQKDVKVRPDVVDDITESSDKTVSENNAPDNNTLQTGATSDSSTSSSAMQKETGSAYSANTPVGSSDSEVISDMILNGVN